MSKRKQQADQAFGGSREAAFVQQLTSLNKRFAAWVEAQDTTELWTDGVEDYLKYAKELISDFGDVLDAAQTPAAKSLAPEKAAAGGISFGATTSAMPAAGVQPSGFFFGALPSTGASVGGGAFSAEPFTGFNFAQSTSGAFGAASSGAQGAPAGAWGSQPASGDAEGGEEEEEEEAEPSLELEPSDAEILSKHRVKLLSQVDGAWKSRGPGTLSIRRPMAVSKSGARAPYLVFTLDTGRVLLSAPLVKNMKPMVPPKQLHSVLMALINTTSGAQESGTHLFKCESADAAQALLAQVNSHI